MTFFGYYLQYRHSGQCHTVFQIGQVVYTATNKTQSLFAQCPLQCLLLLGFYILDGPGSMALFLIPGNFAIFVRCECHCGSAKNMSTFLKKMCIYMCVCGYI